jgi:hypothetical protein
MAPRSFLSQLQHTVLTISELRCPKWRFRLDDDLVIQVQPRPGTRLLFVGTVIQGHGILRAHFESWQSHRDHGLLAAKFEIWDRPASEQWEVHFTRWSHRGTLDPDALAAFKAHTLEGLLRLADLKASMRFEPACLACGKSLTDPVSQARWFGPECARDHTLDVGLFSLPSVGDSVN